MVIIGKDFLRKPHGRRRNSIFFLRFAKLARQDSIAVLPDPDVAQVSDSGEVVNAVLRVLMNTMPAVGNYRSAPGTCQHRALCGQLDEP